MFLNNNFRCGDGIAHVERSVANAAIKTNGIVGGDKIVDWDLNGDGPFKWLVTNRGVQDGDTGAKGLKKSRFLPCA